MSFLIFFKLCISALFVANEQYFKAITSAFLQHHHFTKATGIFKDVTVTFFYYRVSPSLSAVSSTLIRREKPRLHLSAKPAPHYTLTNIGDS